MTQDEIIAMADAAGIDPYDMCSDHRIGVHRLEHFASLLAEDFARVCESLFQTQRPYQVYAEAAQECAAAIRARGTKEGV